MNTATQVRIYNMALSAIGVSKQVASVGEGSLQSLTLNNFWEIARDQCLEDFPWGFANRLVALQLATITTPQWLFTYVYPTDCVQARLVIPTEPSTGTAVVPGYLSAPTYNFWDMMHSRHRIPFSIVENEVNGGLGIATNLPDATLAYTARITTIVLWSSAFVNALALMLGSYVIAPLSANPKYATAIGQAYKEALLKAGAMTLNEGPEKPLPESDFTRIMR